MQERDDFTEAAPAGPGPQASGDARRPVRTGSMGAGTPGAPASPEHGIFGMAGLSGLGERLFASQPERLIRAGRLISASFAFLAIYLDPTRPTRNVTETYAILAAYLLYSAWLVAVRSRRPLGDRGHFFTHAIDIIVLGTLAFLSGELASPFFAFFTFALITAAMRWGLSGAIVTALILDALLVAVGWPYLDPTRSDLNILIMRSVYALVAAALLGYFASYREHSRRRLMQLASWPAKTATEDEEPWLASSLRHASAVLGGARLLVLWTEQEEPTGGLIYSDGAECAFHAAPATSCQSMIDTSSEAPRFRYGDIDEALDLPAPLQRLLGPEFLDALPERDLGRPILCTAGFSSPRYRGRLFVIDPGPPNDDVLSLAGIVAARIASELEQLAMMRELTVAAGWRERGRLARDLHDSVLQDLTAAALQLKAASRRPADTVHTTLDTVASILTEQQRRIRRFVESSRPPPVSPPEILREQLEVFALALSRQWQCTLDIDVNPAKLALSGRLSAEICQLVSEATANAVRHGNARHMNVLVRSLENELEIDIVDDGEGLAESMAADETRPQSIRERVRDLGGETSLSAGDGGLNISIRLPL